MINALAENMEFDEISHILEIDTNNEDVMMKITEALNMSDIEQQTSRLRHSSRDASELLGA